MAFLSHPTDESDHLLSEHLLKVGDSTRKLLSEIEGIDGNTAFLTGFFHDIGKLNPHYQIPFRKGLGTDKNDRDYQPCHSVFSAFIAKDVLTQWNSNRLIACVHGHHGSLKEQLYSFGNYRGNSAAINKVYRTISAINKDLPVFFAEVFEKCPELKKWVEVKNTDVSEFSDSEENVQAGKEWENFFEANMLFSGLLQADRGYFRPWKTPKFDLAFDTSKLFIPNSDKICELRGRFQKNIFSNNEFKGGLLVLEAPTGIGKTKIFLEIANKLSRSKAYERVYYFSPLLALTDDFEGKVNKTLDGKDEGTLVYNHIFKGNLAESQKRKSGENAQAAYGEPEDEEDLSEISWDFETESFNKKLIITTTQRLLITLFSNYTKDKIKLLSLKNSLLIVDEVQTIPKAILPAFVKLLGIFAEKAGLVVLFVSATVPHALRNIPRIKTDLEICKNYLELTKKKINYRGSPPDFSEARGLALFMHNTRKKAFENSKDCDVYLTSGVRKKDLRKRIAGLESGKDCIVVSTQVVEAGVDKSFDSMFRELAPLDSIVQAMGRLNREAKNPNARLVVFGSDGDPTPYSNLEYRLSKEFFENNPETDSITLLRYLVESYYPEIDGRNMMVKCAIDKLNVKIEKQKYSEVWQFVSGLMHEKSFSVYVPESKPHLLEMIKTFNEKRINRGFKDVLANFPASEFWTAKDELFDDKLAEMGIFVPREDVWDDFYDEKTGLDKWLGK